MNIKNYLYNIIFFSNKEFKSKFIINYNYLIQYKKNI